jgi:hypothetical protein
MAGDWIKIEHTLPDKPEIDALAVALGIDHDAVVGKLVRLWVWADQQTVSGEAIPVTEPFLNRITNCPGFASALVDVGWMKWRNGRIYLPKFDRHNGQTAKSRALTSCRMKRLRDGANVTEASPEKRREEKRREDIGEVSPMTPLIHTGGSQRFSKPTVEEVAAYCAERSNGIDANAFVDYYESKGWLIGKSPMKCWKSAVRNWEKNNRVSTNGNRRNNEPGAGQQYVPGRELGPV